MKSLKTPLRYPGGKSRACTKMDQYFPDLRNYEEFREPFLGGGSVAIYITKKYPDIKVWVNDLYNPLYNFWCILRDEPEELHRCLKGYKEDYGTPELARQLFNEMKIQLNHEESEDFYRAVAFYIINKCSFSGLTESSSSFSAQASESNFSMRGIEKLPEYSKLIANWHITNYSYDYLMDGNKSAFMYLDPPYDIKDNLYGRKGSMHNGFDHDKFASDCDSCSMDQLISYNSDQLVKERFKNWNAAEFDLTYTMRSVGEYMREQKDRKELLLFNYGTERLAQLN
jgi:site-specific DNA-adenine methylase